MLYIYKSLLESQFTACHLNNYFGFCLLEVQYTVRLAYRFQFNTPDLIAYQFPLISYNGFTPRQLIL